jgi:hypothetical protein
MDSFIDNSSPSAPDGFLSRLLVIPTSYFVGEPIPDHFVGEPIPDGEARQRWPERYAAKVAKVTIPCLTAVPASDSLMSDQHVLSW